MRIAISAASRFYIPKELLGKYEMYIMPFTIM